MSQPEPQANHLLTVPSTAWREVVAPDETQRFAHYAELFAALQARKSAHYGQGRALHRKTLTGIAARLTVWDGLPDFARHGLFAQAGEWDTTVRLSNGGMDKVSDARPDLRGFALAVQGVERLAAPSALGPEVAKRQCFTLINHETVAFESSAEFVAFAMAMGQGPAALLRHLVQAHGWRGGARKLAVLVSTLSKPFKGFANDSFYSAAPIACGPYAVRLRLVPDAGNGPTNPKARRNWGADMADRLGQQDLNYQLELQPFVDETLTPIENTSINWTTPYTPVARLHLPRQDLTGPQGLALRSQVEAGLFDPWSALADHRPLGDVMRARKVVYYASQQGRGAV
jgi:hypothetical protein